MADELSLFWIVAAFVIFIFLICQAVREFRRKSYVWAIAGAVCVLLFAFMPMQKHVVTIDLSTPK